MTDFLFDLAKTLGYLPGVFAAAFLIWDRYAKHRPIAIIVTRPLMGGSQQIVPFLLLRNASDRPILVSWHNDRTKLLIAKDQTAEGIFGYLKDRTVISLGAESEAYLPVMRPGNYDEIDPDNVMELQLRWRFAQPRIWVADRRLRISLLKRDFKEMINGFMHSSTKGRDD